MYIVRQTPSCECECAAMLSGLVSCEASRKSIVPERPNFRPQPPLQSEMLSEPVSVIVRPSHSLMLWEQVVRLILSPLFLVPEPPWRGRWCGDCAHAARRLTRFSGPGHYYSANHPWKFVISDLRFTCAKAAASLVQL